MDKLIVMKFKASYCRACMAIEAPFLETKNEPTLSKLPIVWAECTASMSNKVLFRQLGVLSLPTIHFYDNGQLIENFACGPAKIPLLRQKLVEVLTRRLDPTTLELKPIVVDPTFVGNTLVSESPPADMTRSSVVNDVFDSTITTAVDDSGRGDNRPRKIREIRIGDELIKQEHIDFLRKELPFFQSVSDEEFDTMLSKASLQTFLPGDIIIRQGRPGKTFFVIKSGTVEMCIRSRFELPISTPSSYLGAVVNQLTKFDYFGERALTTGEPYAASVRVLTKTRCFAFDATIIPETSILSQKRRATQELVDQLNVRYVLPGDYKESYNYPTTAKDECILDLLVRFKQVRQTAKCFEYVMKAKPLLGNKGEIARRSMLVSKLSNSQRQDFIDVFQMADVHQRGTISLLEMRRFMESARKNVHYTDDELLDIIRKANPESMDAVATTVEATTTSRTVSVMGGTNNNNNQERDFGTTGITLNEFLGVMAEAEFYYLFTETFQELDQDNTGYVRAGDLDEVLNGVRFLITDDRKSIIDVEDQDVQVDYEQFAKMLLGAAL
jgi:CRP-like cAMP-binding protein